MIPNHSPWINQLKRTRPPVPLNQNISTDVAIVGGGIAGISTAFFTLRNTSKSVVLVEADKIAHGATGHNAGQITSYFERPLSELVEEFGLEMAIDGQRSVEYGWTLLDEIVNEAELKTPFYRFTGYTGLSSLEQVLLYLQNNLLRLKGGLQTETIILDRDWDELTDIPKEFESLYALAEKSDLMNLLETKNSDYVACVAYQKGCTNSALFCEELIGYLISTYKSRFSFFEKSPVSTVRLGEGSGALEILSHEVSARKIVLCTNGFENFKIINQTGPEIDTKFHHLVAGRIGYMSGYMEPINHSPIAISYFPKNIEHNIDPTGDSYFYLTRRPHEHEGKNSYNLVSTGGPEKVLPNGADYSRKDDYSDEARIAIDDFLKTNYNKHPDDAVGYSFFWHGLMGYTPNGVRKIGFERLNPVLLYNLGCNGVGILPSVFGGSQISRLLNEEKIKPSMFDPQ